MIDENLISYDKCQEYARALCGSYGIPECDVGDIGGDAYLLSICRAWRAAPSENDEAAANRLTYTSVIDVIRRRNRHSVRILSDAEDVSATGEDDGDAGDDETPDRGIVVSDYGKNAAELADRLDWQNPFWLRLFRNERRKLKGVQKQVVKILMKDSRLPLARAAIKVSRPTFLTIVKKLREHFDLVFRALREWRGGN